jgi:hypothetical protein
MTELFISAAAPTFSAILMHREVRMVKRFDAHRRRRGLL